MTKIKTDSILICQHWLWVVYKCFIQKMKSKKKTLECFGLCTYFQLYLELSLL